jgi:hypothetical protein
MSLIISFFSRVKNFFDTIDYLEEQATYAQAGFRPGKNG